jgi:hypothetical protein
MPYLFSASKFWSTVCQLERYCRFIDLTLGRWKPTPTPFLAPLNFIEVKPFSQRAYGNALSEKTSVAQRLVVILRCVSRNPTSEQGSGAPSTRLQLCMSCAGLAQDMLSVSGRSVGWGTLAARRWSSSTIYCSRRVGRFLDGEPSSYRPQYEKTSSCQAQGGRLLRWHRTNLCLPALRHTQSIGDSAG